MKRLKKFMALGMAVAMLMSNATVVLADVQLGEATVGTEKTATEWGLTDTWADESSFQSDENDSWKVTKLGDNNSATLVNTTSPTKLTVKLQDKNATLEDVNIKVYQIFEITQENTEGGSSNSNGEYSYKLANEAFEEFFKEYFKFNYEDEADVLEKINAIKTQEEAAALAKALAVFVEDNEETDVEPVAEYTGNANEKTYTFDLSRQYTYDGNNGEYSLGKGYYFITRDDAIDSTYTLRVLDKDKTTITLKGTVPSLTKTGNDVVMQVGDNVTYTLQSKLAYSKGNEDYKYIIYDHLEDTMAARQGTLNVSVGGMALTAPNDYTVDWNTKANVDLDGDGTEEMDIPVIAIKLNFSEKSKLYNDAYVGKDVVVTYEATMLTTATTGNDKNKGYENYNKAWLLYGEDEDTDTTTVVEWDVYTIALEITKTDESENELPGAEFSLYADATKRNPYKFSVATVEVESDGENNEKTYKSYYYVDTKGSITRLVTDADGKIEIRGLDEGSYYLSETNPPEGYQAVDDQLVTIDADESIRTDSFSALTANTTGDSNTSKITSTQVADGYVKMLIKDPTEGSDDLPATGGTGRIIVYILGSFMLLGGGTAYVVSRKRKMA